MRPRLFAAGRADRGQFSPRSFKDIGRAISYLRNLGNIADRAWSNNISTLPASSATICGHGRGAVVKYACDRSNSIPARISSQMAL